METQTATKSQWVLDPTHTELTFKVRHMMLTNVSGYFERFTGSIESEGEDFLHGSAEVSIDVDSVNTKNTDRDAHLKSDDFFNAELYPQILFKSRSFDGKKLTGDLSIRDITKEIVLDAEFTGIASDPYGQTKAGFEITGSINRKDFDLKWNAVTEAGNIVVSDNVKIEIQAQFVKQ